MRNKIRLYPYGFIFSDEKIESFPDYYSSLRIMNKYDYVFDSLVDSVFLEKNDKFIIIHGHHVHINISEEEYSESLTEKLIDSFYNNYEEFLKTIDFLAGRYVILIGDADNIYVYPDAINSRSTHYTDDRIVVSSHIQLICDNFNYKKDPLNDLVPKLNITLQKTAYSHINSMIPNYYVDLKNRRQVRFFPRNNNEYKDIDNEEKLYKIEKLWREQLKYYISKYEKIFLSFSGGLDSRTSLAMFRDNTEKLELFTYHNDNDENEHNQLGMNLTILENDKKIVSEFLNYFPYRHKFFSILESENDLTDTEKVTLSKNTIQTHIGHLVSVYIENFQGRNGIHLRSNAFEIARNQLHPTNRENSINSVKFSLNYAFRKAFHTVEKEKLNELFVKLLDDLNYGENLFDFHILDLYHWENRVGRWNSENLNETDAAFDTFHPMGLRALIEILLSFSDFEKVKGYPYRDLINRNMPLFNFFGYNDLNNLYENFKYNELAINNLNPSIIDQFRIVDQKNNIVEEVKIYDNSMLVPLEYIERGYSAVSSVNFLKEKGIAKLRVVSPFLSKSGKDYLSYEVYKNTELLLKEDMADWKFSNDINIYNLEKDDKISIKINVLKTSKSLSWENASKIIINGYEEIESEFDSPIKVSCNSLYSECFNSDS